MPSGRGIELSLPGVVMFAAGVVLLYSGVKKKDPRKLIAQSLGFQKPDAEGIGDAPAGDPNAPGAAGGGDGSHPGDASSSTAGNSSVGHGTPGNPDPTGDQRGNQSLGQRLNPANATPTPVPGTLGFGSWVINQGKSIAQGGGIADNPLVRAVAPIPAAAGSLLNKLRGR